MSLRHSHLKHRLQVFLDNVHIINECTDESTTHEYEDIDDPIKRCPDGFTKLELVGQGANAMVWYAEEPESIVALKQFPKLHDKD